MNLRRGPLLVLPLVVLLGCPNEFPPSILSCEEHDLCGSTGAITATTVAVVPTTSDGGDTVPVGSSEASTGPTPDDDTTSTTAEPCGPPSIVTHEVVPDYTNMNTMLVVNVTTSCADSVRMQLDAGELIDLSPVRPDAFTGKIAAFTGLDNGEHTAHFTPSRDMLDGESKDADYVIALPAPNAELFWQPELDLDGAVAAIAILPDGRPVELGTFHEQGASRCYLRLRERTGAPIDFIPLLPDAVCTAIDLAIDRDTGVLHVLLERESNGEPVWWAGEISSWGAGVKKIGEGQPGDTALALASRPGLVAVCGSKPVATPDKRDALAVLLRPNEPPEEHLFDYKSPLWMTPALFTETARDCAFAGDTLVLVGEAHGQHDKDSNMHRDRLIVIEHDGVAEMPAWTVAGPKPGLQSRALAIAVDVEGRYHLAGYTCLDDCEPEGEIRLYEPGAKLVGQVPLGLLGSEWFGPHDIAWSPAGYVVVALGGQQGDSTVFKVQAFAPDVFDPLWTFIPNEKVGLQMALAVAVGPYGEVYAGGLAETNHPAFAFIGG